MVEVLLIYLYSDHITMYHHHNATSTTAIANNNPDSATTVAMPALSKKFSTKYNNKFSSTKLSTKFATKDYKPSGRFSSHFHIYISSSDSSTSSSEESESDLENNKTSSKRNQLEGSKQFSLSDKLGFRATFKQSKADGKGKSYEILRKRSANHYFGGVGLLYQVLYCNYLYYCFLLENHVLMAIEMQS